MKLNAPTHRAVLDPGRTTSGSGPTITLIAALRCVRIPWHRRIGYALRRRRR